MPLLDIPNFHRLLTQMRHHNLAPALVHSQFYRGFPRFPKLRHEFEEAIRYATQGLCQMDEVELVAVVEGLPWFLQDGVRVSDVLRGDASSTREAAFSVVVGKLQQEYFSVNDSLRPLESQHRDSEVLARFPELGELIDDDGLLRLNDETTLTDQYLAYRGHCLYYHQFFRRNYTGNINPQFFHRLSEYRKGRPDARVRVAIDHRRIISEDQYVTFVERDWWGLLNPMDTQHLDDPNATGLLTVRPSPDQPALLCPFDRTEVLCYVQEVATKVFEMEEVTKGDSMLASDLPVTLNRYVHSERSMTRAVFQHLDGAVRSYSKPTYQKRVDGDIARAKSLSERIKLFRIDGLITETDWADLVGQFYRGNDTVLAYLSKVNAEIYRS